MCRTATTDGNRGVAPGKGNKMRRQELLDLAARIDRRVVRNINWAYYRERLEDLANELWADVDVSVGNAVREELGMPEHSEGLDAADHFDVHDETTAGRWDAMLRKLVQVFGDRDEPEPCRLVYDLGPTSDETDGEAINKRTAIGEAIRAEVAASGEHPYDINNGNCEEFTLGVIARMGGPGEDLYECAPGEHELPEILAHRWIWCDGLHYDAEEPAGVENWRDLPIFARMRREYDEGAILAVLGGPRAVGEEGASRLQQVPIEESDARGR